ncbi:hypothetical protein SK128_000142 [Halocaridina rubra]|uniref:Uncharacterized protein n=1 Tax=Halocaridina rubra TaxID=373956 RepID=A0AAN8WQE7_HALRR
MDESLPTDFLTVLQILLWKRQRDLINARQGRSLGPRLYGSRALMLRFSLKNIKHYVAILLHSRYKSTSQPASVYSWRVQATDSIFILPLHKRTSQPASLYSLASLSNLETPILNLPLHKRKYAGILELESYGYAPLDVDSVLEVVDSVLEVTSVEGRDEVLELGKEEFLWLCELVSLGDIVSSLYGIVREVVDSVLEVTSVEGRDEVLELGKEEFLWLCELVSVADPVSSLGGLQFHPRIIESTSHEGLSGSQVLHFLLWTMNGKESHDVDAENIHLHRGGEHESEEQSKVQLHLQQQESINHLEEIRVQGHDRLHQVLPLQNDIQQGHEGPKEPGGQVRRPGCRSKSGIGPPPRPFKKARYAWEIKNYEHTLSNMAQNIGECSADIQDESQDSQSSDVNSEGSQEDGVLDHREGLLQESLDRATFIDSRSRGRVDLMPPIMPAPYPTTYGMMTAPIPPDGTLRPSDCFREHQQIPPDPDAGILRWHTRQLCRSIFDNTVNRMLENMGFSPVTERNQGIHPLLVLSLSDDEEREAEEAQQRALENEALTAAMHHKGLFLPTYSYDALESGGTTTDYDSSDDDSDLGEDPVPDDLSHEAHLHMTHMINRPLPRVPVIPAAMPIIPTMPSDHITPLITHPVSPIPVPNQQSQEPVCDLDEQACDSATLRKDTQNDIEDEEGERRRRKKNLL